MREMDLVNMLDNLVDEEFKKFKWHLKNEKLDNTEPIKPSQLSKAEREDVVDLMVQNYQLSGAVAVMKSVLRKINRNDLVTKISKMEPGPAAGPGSVSPGVPAGRNTAEEKLKMVRTRFIDSASDPVLRKLLDHLLEDGMINDDEMEAMAVISKRAEKARVVIDTVRRKGSAASSAMVSALCEVDPCLSKELNLM